MPQTQGATFLYQSLVDPTLTRHEQEIDSALALAQEQATTTGAEWGRQGLATLQRVAVNGLSKGQHILNEQTKITELTNGSLKVQERQINLSSTTSNINSKNDEQTKEQESLLSYIFSSYNKLSSFSSLIPNNKNLKNNSILPDEIINASPREQQVYIQKQRKQLERMLKNLDDAQEDIYTRTKK
ncbi:3450_t:CDS:2 [Diversispora eburnea]|uniref:3450_t:CDS:1 n=1 Tax=Diversispora eburnea TaxID=1213867 RepID=A0A9N8WKB4_9GLOM|nr:3450_t:CDS:2 [Diversispora eburnea]